jgi:hypothetical protein
MGMPIHPFFDHNSPDWPDNELGYLKSFLRTQAIMGGVILGSTIVFVIVLGIVLVLRQGKL